jgi:hypothetical protein
MCHIQGENAERRGNLRIIAWRNADPAVLLPIFTDGW